jgi:hypothetical protein
LCRSCTHRRLQHFKTFKSFSRKITNFELLHYCRKWAMFHTRALRNTYIYIVNQQTQWWNTQVLSDLSCSTHRSYLTGCVTNTCN